MSTYGAVPVPADCWGLDSAQMGALTDTQFDALAAFDLGALHVPGYAPAGKPVVAWFYAPFAGAAASAWDASARAIQAWCDHGGLAGIVQHCRSSTVANADNGQADGERMAAFVTALGYPPDAYVALDDEAVVNPGPDAVARVHAWCAAMVVAAQRCVYIGYSAGLSPAQEYAEPLADRYWGAEGVWTAAVRDVCCRQGPSVVIHGVTYDLDHFHPDKLGGVLRLMGRTDLVSPVADTIPPTS